MKLRNSGKQKNRKENQKMERNYGEEIDALRKEIEELKNLITGTVSFCMENQSKQQEKESEKNRSSVRRTVVQKMKQMQCLQ